MGGKEAPRLVTPSRTMADDKLRCSVGIHPRARRNIQKLALGLIRTSQLVIVQRAAGHLVAHFPTGSIVRGEPSGMEASSSTVAWIWPSGTLPAKYPICP